MGSSQSCSLDERSAGDAPASGGAHAQRVARVAAACRKCAQEHNEPKCTPQKATPTSTTTTTTHLRAGSGSRLRRRKRAPTQTNQPPAAARDNREDNSGGGGGGGATTSNDSDGNARRVQFASGANCAKFCRSIGGKLKSPKLVSAAQSLVTGCGSPKQAAQLWRIGARASDPFGADCDGGGPDNSSNNNDANYADNSDDDNNNNNIGSNNNKSDVAQLTTTTGLAPSNSNKSDCVSTGILCSATAAPPPPKSDSPAPTATAAATVTATATTTTTTTTTAKLEIKRRAKGIQRHLSNGSSSGASYIARRLPALVTGAGKRMRRKSAAPDCALLGSRARPKPTCSTLSAAAAAKRRPNALRADPIESGDVFIYPTTYRDQNECQKCERDNKICNCNLIESPNQQTSETNDTSEAAADQSVAAASAATERSRAQTRRASSSDSGMGIGSGHELGARDLANHEPSAKDRCDDLGGGGGGGGDDVYCLGQTSCAVSRAADDDDDGRKSMSARTFGSAQATDEQVASAETGAHWSRRRRRRRRASSLGSLARNRCDSPMMQIGSAAARPWPASPAPKGGEPPPTPPPRSAAATGGGYSPMLASAKHFIDSVADIGVRVARTTRTATATTTTATTSAEAAPAGHRFGARRRSSANPILDRSTCTSAFSSSAASLAPEPTRPVRVAPAAAEAAAAAAAACPTGTALIGPQVGAANPNGGGGGGGATGATPTLLSASAVEVEPGSLESPKKRSIFEGASKDEILEYLEYARERVPEVLIAADEVMVISENELIVVNQLEPGSPATPIAIVEPQTQAELGDCDLIAAAAAAATPVVGQPLGSGLIGAADGDVGAPARSAASAARHQSAPGSLSQQLEQLYHASREVNLHFGAPLIGSTTPMADQAAASALDNDNCKTQNSLNIVQIAAASNTAAASVTTTTMTTTCGALDAGRRTGFDDEADDILVVADGGNGVVVVDGDDDHDDDDDDDIVAHLARPSLENGFGPLRPSVEEAALLAAIKDLNLRCAFDTELIRLVHPFAAHANARRAPSKPKRSAQKVTKSLWRRRARRHCQRRAPSKPKSSVRRRSVPVAARAKLAAPTERDASRQLLMQSRHLSMRKRASCSSSASGSSATAANGAAAAAVDEAQAEAEVDARRAIIAGVRREPTSAANCVGHLSVTSARSSASLSASSSSSSSSSGSTSSTPSSTTSSSASSTSSSLVAAAAAAAAADVSSSSPLGRTSGNNCGAHSDLYASPALSCSSPFLAIGPIGPLMAHPTSAAQLVAELAGGLNPFARLASGAFQDIAPDMVAAAAAAPNCAFSYTNNQIRSSGSASMSPDTTISGSACGSPAPLVERGDSGLGADLHLHLHTPTALGVCPLSPAPPAAAKSSAAPSDGAQKEAAQAAKLGVIEELAASSTRRGAPPAKSAPSPVPPAQKKPFNAGQSPNYLSLGPGSAAAIASNLLSPINLLSKSSHCHYAILIRLNNYLAACSQSSDLNHALAMESQCIDCDQFLVMDPMVVASRIQKIRSLLGPNFSENPSQERSNGGLTESFGADKKQTTTTTATTNNERQQPISRSSTTDLPTLEQIDKAYIAAINELPLCKACEKRRAERKEIISEFAETEFKYGRDLKIILDEFYRPMQIAGLLSKEQINGIFLNLEELIMAHCRFFDRLSTAIGEAHSLDDRDLTIVSIGKIFVESAEMLHTFESYCIRQGSAACLLARLAKEKELLRIFLRVSQMENTLLRRMNLAAFLMVPVQRITRYPLLLNRLYKVTPYHHRDREALRDAQLKVELHLEHINQQTKGSGATSKIWRRFSNLSTPAASTRRGLLNTEDISYIKMRNTALDILKWHRDDAQFIHSGVLSFSPLNEYLVKQKTKSLRFISAHALLIVLGKPNWKYRPDLVKSTTDNKLARPTPGGNGIKEAALLLFREKNSRFVLCREPLILSNTVLSTDCSHYNNECPSQQASSSNANNSTGCSSSSSSSNNNNNNSALSNNNSNNGHSTGTHMQHIRTNSGPKSASTSTASNTSIMAGDATHTGYSNGNRKSLPGRLQVKEIDLKPINMFEATHSCFASSMQVDPSRSTATPTSTTSTADCANNGPNNRFSARTNSDTNSEGECAAAAAAAAEAAALVASTTNSNHSRSDTISVSSLKNSPDDFAAGSAIVVPHPISPPLSLITPIGDEFGGGSHQAPRSNSLVAQLSKSPITTTSSSTNLIKSTSATSSNLAILNSLMTKVNNYHKYVHGATKQAQQQQQQQQSQQTSFLRPTSPAHTVTQSSGSTGNKKQKAQFESVHSRSSTNIANIVTCSSDSTGAKAVSIDSSPASQHQQLSSLNKSNEYQADAFRSMAYGSYAANNGGGGAGAGDGPNNGSGISAPAQAQQQQQHQQHQQQQQQQQQQHQSIRQQYNHHFFHNHSHQAYGDYEESFEIHDRVSKESLLVRADTPLKTRYWLQMLRYHSKDLGQWRFRRNALANIMMMHQE